MNDRPSLIAAGICSYGHTIRGLADVSIRGKSENIYAVCRRCVHEAEIEMVSAFFLGPPTPPVTTHVPAWMDNTDAIIALARGMRRHVYGHPSH